MFGFRLSVKQIAGVLLAGSMASGAVAAQAQTTHRTRRESSANRKARIARTIAETYSHRYEVAGGGGYLRFDSGVGPTDNASQRFCVWSSRILFPTNNQRRGAVNNSGSVSRGDESVLRESWS